MRPAADLVDLLRQQVGKRYELGVSVDLTDPDPPVFDCAELLSWGVYQLTRQLVGCLDDTAPIARAEPYSGSWAALATRRTDLRIAPEVAANTPGAVLVRAPSTTGGIGHVALSTGAGGTVEAYDSSRGVITSSAFRRRWTHGVMVPGLGYELRPALDLAAPSVLRPWARGANVLRVQAALRAAGFDPGALDGVYGPKTAKAVAQFQSARHLVPDGEVGPITAAALGVPL